MPQNSNIPTLKTIAEIAKVSEATVSRALNNHPSQSKTTNERIQKIAKEIGYVKHPYVTALMKHMRQGTTVRENPIIALIHCMPFENYPNPFMDELREGATLQANALGFKIDHFYLKKKGMSPERLYEILVNRGVRGIIFEHVGEGDIPDEFDLSRFACATTQYSHGLPFLHKVNVNVYFNLLNALNQCIQRGYERIGLFLSRTQEINNHYLRRAAFRAAEDKFASKAKLYVEEKSEGFNDFDIKFWIQENDLQVVLCSLSRMPKIIRDAGMEIPENVSYVSLDIVNPDPFDLTGIMAGWKQVGVSATNQVVDQLIRNEFGRPKSPIRTTVEGQWHEGSTLPNLLPDSDTNFTRRTLDETIFSTQ